MRIICTGLYYVIGISFIIFVAFQGGSQQSDQLACHDDSAMRLYETHCLNCHGSNGYASWLPPESLTRQEWKTFFSEGKHLGRDLTDVVEPFTLHLIQNYLVQTGGAPDDDELPDDK